ncbi:MAG: hypothetical protein OK449_03530 [Thaumarchaeota archaeon]|nr:hypothetical protein [Nitrososphaerota archaeon]
MSSEIANKLSEQTKGLVSRFEGRMTKFRGRDDLLGLLRPLEKSAADEFARTYFGEGEHTAIGIDGSRAFDERLQMMLFYANATGYTCPFRVGDRITFDLAKAKRGVRLSATAAIPLWAEDFSDVLPDMPEIELELEYSMERIPNAFMTLAEIYLATRAVESARIIFMDRPLSGTYSTLARDARLLMRKGFTNLGKLTRSPGQNTIMDLSLATTLGAPFMTIPSRKKYTTHRILRELMKEDLTGEELMSRLSISERQLSSATKRLKKYDEGYKGELFEEVGPGRLKLREGASGYWKRSVELATRYTDRVYEAGESPLNVGDDEWLTILDVNTIALVLLIRLCELSVDKKVLLIGLAKDTTATDIHRAVLPFAVKNEMVRLRAPPPSLKNDKAFLSILSAMNRGLEIPWRTAGYDSAFSTMVATPSGDEFKPARKVVSREELFVRGFFQSRSLGSSGKIRSQVFLFDRAFDSQLDSGDVGAVEVKEISGPTMVTPYFEGKETSAMSNLILRILAITDNPEVYEAFGHNQLLYLADKAVKAEIRLMRSSLRGVADLRLGSISKREQVYGIMTPYREQRAGTEASRMREASRVE